MGLTMAPTFQDGLGLNEYSVWYDAWYAQLTLMWCLLIFVIFLVMTALSYLRFP